MERGAELDSIVFSTLRISIIAVGLLGWRSWTIADVRAALPTAPFPLRLNELSMVDTSS